MDVFLIPTTTTERYALYYEAPEDEVVERDEGGGIFQRMKRQFAETLREAEEWRHRRHEQQPRPTSILARARRKVMGFVVERIAEQRLLWHMRHATEICAAIPADLPESDADQIIRTTLKKDADHHLKWLVIDATLLLLSLPLTVIPGPNVPGFYFAFQVVGHYLSMRGAKQGLSVTQWSFKVCPELSELRHAMTLEEVPRQRIFHDIQQRLRLEHLATFCEDVAAPPA